MNEKHTDTILDVPYYSQYRDIQNTKNAHRACGITCIKMLLDYYEIESESLDILVSKHIVDESAYGPSGWNHDFFVDYLKCFRLKAYRKEKIEEVTGILEIQESILQGNPVIVSVEQRLFDRKMFHMILIVGVRANEAGDLLGLYYNDPGRLTETNGKDKYVSIDDFVKYWRNMAIFII